MALTLRSKGTEIHFWEWEDVDKDPEQVPVPHPDGSELQAKKRTRELVRATEDGTCRAGGEAADSATKGTRVLEGLTLCVCISYRPYRVSADAPSKLR